MAAGCRAADPALAPAPWLTRRPPRLSQYERLELVMRLFLRALQRLLLGLLSQSHEPPPNRYHAWQLRLTGASRRAHARRPAAHQTRDQVTPENDDAATRLTRQRQQLELTTTSNVQPRPQSQGIELDPGHSLLRRRLVRPPPATQTACYSRCYLPNSVPYCPR